MGDIVSDVIALYEQLNARPIAQAIWFVDRPGAYFRLRYYLQETLQHEASSPPDVDFTPICAMRLHFCRAAEARERIAALLDRGWTIERARRVWPFCQPGVWVQMSNGKHRRYEIVDVLPRIQRVLRR